MLLLLLLGMLQKKLNWFKKNMYVANMTNSSKYKDNEMSDMWSDNTCVRKEHTIENVTAFSPFFSSNIYLGVPQKSAYTYEN